MLPPPMGGNYVGLLSKWRTTALYLEFATVPLDPDLYSGCAPRVCGQNAHCHATNEHRNSEEHGRECYSEDPEPF
jgi:hypothetical protein